MHLTGSICILVVLILSGCTGQLTTHYNVPTRGPRIRFALVNLTFWVNDPGRPNYYRANIPQMLVPENAPFSYVLLRAKIINKTFSCEDYPYTMAINGFRERPWDNYNWVLYLLPGPPDPENPPGQEYLAPDGRVETRANEGDNFLFWLHDFTWQPWVDYD